MAAVLPQKRTFGEATSINARHINNIDSSPVAARKRKLGNLSSPAQRLNSSQGGFKGRPGTIQPSQFETEVLHKFTQDINELKKNNSERDQEWARPSIDTFNPKTDAICFQSIEAEEGTLHGGKVTVKLFGVTEVTIPAACS